MIVKRQRVRDPVHNLIEFDKDQFETVMWRVIQTAPFQRLRRIKQLGFSDLVYPGATHTRFAHCVGAFHTARQLMQIISRDINDQGRQFQEHQAKVALAAALLHDLGHGMFSHAFEDIGRKLDLRLAHHEAVSDLLIRKDEVAQVLSELGSGFANDVADVIKKGRPGNLYDAVVSSQFDADRLDYMQRDRLLTGVQNSHIDFTWMINNLMIATVPTGVDDESLDAPIETFIIGPKAISAAETYVLSLFQLYPTVYFHKATRGIEKLFSALMTRLIELAKSGHSKKTGLPDSHPLIKFALDGDSLGRVLALDDTVFWGALPLMTEASDSLISQFAKRIRERRLPKCIDIRERLIAEIKGKYPQIDRKETGNILERSITHVETILEARSSEKEPRILLDRAERNPYKRFEESKGPLNQILVKTTNGAILDLAELSPTVAGIEKFHLFRAYVERDDTEAEKAISESIIEALRSDDVTE